MSPFIPTFIPPLPPLPTPPPYDIAQGTAAHGVWTEATWLYPWILDTIPIQVDADYVPYRPDPLADPSSLILAEATLIG